MFAEARCPIAALRGSASGRATAPRIGRRVNLIAASVLVPPMPPEVGFVRTPWTGLYRRAGYEKDSNSDCEHAWHGGLLTVGIGKYNHSVPLQHYCSFKIIEAFVHLGLDVTPPTLCQAHAAISRLIRYTADTPVPHSRAVLRMPVPFRSSARICSTLCRGSGCCPIGLPRDR
jgi:hypothetical protein